MEQWLRLYSLALAGGNQIRKVRELCDELLGPIVQSETAGDEAMIDEVINPGVIIPLREGAHQPIAGWKPRLLGLRKRQLLKQVVLPSLATNRSLQRLLAEYLDMLNGMV